MSVQSFSWVHRFLLLFRERSTRRKSIMRLSPLLGLHDIISKPESVLTILSLGFLIVTYSILSIPYVVKYLPHI